MRLFIALPVPQSAQEILSAAQKNVQAAFSGALLTWSDPTKTHCTLHFLGETPEEKMTILEDGIQEAVNEWRKEGRVCRLTTAAAISGFPTLAAARVAVMPIRDTDNAAAELHCRLATVLQRQGFAADPRPWVPHLTIGRVREKTIDLRKVGHRKLETADWSPDKVELMASKLTPSGPKYSIVRSFPL